MLLSLFFANFLFSYCTADIAADLKHVLDSYDFDPKCVFNYTEVTSKTIKFFPKCETVYGILVINEKTDLTVSQLNVTFSTMTTLIGGMRIENTNFTDLFFLTVDKEDDFFSLYCGKYGIFIENNKYLTNARILWRMYHYGDDFGTECNFQVMNNPQLDAENLCDYGYMPLYMDLKIKGNLKDCGCQGDEITESTASSYKNCTKLLRGFQLDDVIIIENLPSFSNVKLIRGGIDIKNSGVHNLSFFESLDTVKVNNEGDGQKLILNLENNPLLERFALPNLREYLNSWNDGIKLANFQGNHPNFCLTIEELSFFLEQQISFLNFNTKLCDDNRTKIATINVCRFVSMSKLPSDCNMIIGDLVVNPGDEDHFVKLENVIYLFGALAIQNTTLKNMDAIGGLRYIAHFNQSLPVIQIVGNPKIEYLTFYSLENIITNGNRTAIIQDNHKDLFFFDKGKCKIFGDESSIYRKRLDATGNQCVFYLSTLYDFYTESQLVITKAPPSLRKYISSELESRARLGNHLFELSSLVGIARSLNRTPVFFLADEGYKWCLEDTNKTAPGLADQFLVIDGAVPKTIRNTVFHTRCCIYEDPRVLSNIEDEHIHLTGRFYQSYKYFEGMRSEQLSWLKESPAELPGLPKSDEQTHVMCVHVRRGDFLGVGFQASDAHFIRNAVEYIKEKENTKKPIKTVVYFGDDPDFMKSIFDGTKLAKDNLSKNASYVISQNSPSDDMLYSKSNCEVFLLSASHSTFGWWLGYFSINNRVYYMDMRVNYVGAYKDGKVNIKDYFLPSWTPLKFANDNSSIIVGDY